jgi:hypothetical protein
VNEGDRLKNGSESMFVSGALIVRCQRNLNLSIERPIDAQSTTGTDGKRNAKERGGVCAMSWC